MYDYFYFYYISKYKKLMESSILNVQGFKTIAVTNMEGNQNLTSESSVSHKKVITRLVDKIIIFGFLS